MSQTPTNSENHNLNYRDYLTKKLIKHHLPLGFLLVMIIGFSWPYPGKELLSYQISGYSIVKSINIILIFIISGLTLKTKDIKAALKAISGFIYGLMSILVITPILGFGIIQIPFKPNEFTIGLTIFSAVPTTISSGVTLVTQAGGNGALALMLTVISNLLGIITVPIAIQLIITSAGNTEISVIDLIVNLAITILVPLFLGKLLRSLIQCIRDFAQKRKLMLSLFSSANLICIVWMNLSDAKEDLFKQRFLDVFLILIASIVMHVIYLVLNGQMARLLRLKDPEYKAVVLMASQKTLPVSVTVISFLDPGNVGNLGLITIPCIVGHLAQIFIDSFIVSRWMSIANDLNVINENHNEELELPDVVVK